MTVFLHEMKLCWKSLLIWSVIVGGMIMLCMVMFPEMAGQSEEIEAMFSTMGGFTDAFGMDKLSIATPLGFYGVEGGAVLGIGGALFAAFVGIRMLSKEEADHTAEFLLTHPLGRSAVVAGKLAAVVAQVVLFNAVCILFAVVSFAMIGEELSGDAFWLFHLAQFLMQLEIACICFGLSAFIKRGGMGLGLGLAGLFYFLNIVANLSEEVEFLRYITPFGYADAANVIPDAAIAGDMLACGVALMAVAVVAGFAYYTRKDIAV